MREKYDRINWVNGDESLATPLSADNLNRMDKAIFEISETMDDLNLDAKAEEIRSLVVQAQDYSAAAEESAKKAMSTTPEGYEKIALAVRTNELAYLGWSVPYEMPIQNYIDANRVFHQKVGRIALSNITWILRGDKANVFEGTLTNKATSSNTVANMYCSAYATDTEARVFNRTTNKTISAVADGKRIRVFDTSFSNVADFVNSLKGVYLYYELATEITFNADGNEKITSLEKHFEVNNFSVPHESLNLIPLPYTSGKSLLSHGITYTVDDNGEITASGTSDGSYATFTLANPYQLSAGTYSILLETSFISDKIYIQIAETSGSIIASKSATGEAATFNIATDKPVLLRVGVYPNMTITNVKLKPFFFKGTVKPNCIGWENSSALVGKALGKNLIKNTSASRVIDGLTITNNGDGTYTINGTCVSSNGVSTGYAFTPTSGDNMVDLIGRKVRLCGMPKGNYNYSSTYLCFRYADNNNYLIDRGSDDSTWRTATLTQKGYILLRINNGEVFNNAIFKPMIVDAELHPNDNYDDFEKFQTLTSADAEKYTKYAKIETDKYGADFIPQYVDYLPNGFCFTDSEQDDLSLLENGVHFLDDGILLLAESTPSTDVNLRIGGVL